MRQELEELRSSAREKIEKAKDKGDIERIRVEFLGRRQGKLTQVLDKMRELPLEDRPTVGKLANEVKSEIQERLKEKMERMKKEEEEESIDVTLPGRKPSLGKLHPITQTLKEIERIFLSLGFRVVRGPEMETEYYNFEALNMPPYHPARDEYDSFYLDNGYLLRSHTSPVQIRVMEKQSPPIRIIAPGKCYRRDAIDSSHFPMFHQVEGLAVDRRITFCDL